MSAALLGNVQQVRPRPLPDLDRYRLCQEKVVCHGQALQQLSVVEIKTRDQLNRNVLAFVIFAKCLDEVNQTRLIFAPRRENWVQITQEAPFLQRASYRIDEPPRDSLRSACET